MIVPAQPEQRLQPLPNPRYPRHERTSSPGVMAQVYDQSLSNLDRPS